RNIEGQALMLWGSFVAEGWLGMLSAVFVRFTDVGLAFDSSDRTVGHFAQDHRMLLLTDNRSQKGADSLEQAIREENSLTSLPVLTIGNVAPIGEPPTHEQ